MQDDHRISEAANALPRAAFLLRPKLLEWVNSPNEMENLQEELFFDPRTHDVYLSITINLGPSGQSFVAKIPQLGLAHEMSASAIALLELDDISHLIDDVARKLISDNNLNAAKIKSVLKASVLLNELATF